MTISIRNLTYQMLREEWRFHERVIGSRAFIAFPLVFALVTLGLLYGGTLYGLETTTMLVIAHLGVFAVGLHMGNIALTGRNAIDDIMSGVRFLVYTSRTMPVSTKRLVGVYLLKNTLYYTGMVTIPISLSFLYLFSPTTLPFLALSFTGMYVWGLVIALLGVNIMSYGAPAKIAATFVFTGALVAWLLDLPVLALTPYGVVESQTVVSLGTGFAPLLVAALLGVFTFRPLLDEQLRMVNDRYKDLSDTLPATDGSVAAKTLLAVNRSNGGLLKLVVSASLLFGVCLYLFTLLDQATDAVALGVAMGALLGLEAVLIYTWLIRFDSFPEYAFLPMTADILVRGKALAFATLALPLVGMHYFTAALVLELDVLDAVLGGLVLGGLLTFFFGVSLVLAQFDPHERLFHPLRFLAFAGALFGPLLGYFVVAFTVPDLTTTVALGIAASALAGFGLGLATLYYAMSTWEVTSP